MDFSLELLDFMAQQDWNFVPEVPEITPAQEGMFASILLAAVGVALLLGCIGGGACL